MAPRKQWRRAAIYAGLAALVVGGVLPGCKRDQPAEPKAETPAPAAPAGPADRLHQTFADACIPYIPEDQIKPADLTLTGKSMGKLYVETLKVWEQIKFRNAQQQPIQYTATLDTEMGTIELVLYPDVAPNHVRNFIVLARIGYYDGLVFERAFHDQSDVVPDGKVEIVEGGCPIGTGQPGLGHLGYWLRPEFSKELKHEEGSVGACLGETTDTAGCRFYISLSRAPVLDGERTIFGKVTRGLDVVRRIATQPVSNTPDYPDGSRPERPTVIRKVTITAKEPAAATAKADKK